MERLDDAVLVERVLEGDQPAFSALVGRYKHAVYGIALSFLDDFDAAEDLAQEVFIKAYHQLRTLDEPARFGNWLRIIAANQCRSHLRRHRPTLVPMSEAEIHRASPDLPAHALSPEQLAEAEEHQARQRKLEAATLEALGRLSDANRQALTLYYLGGHTAAEVGTFLGISTGAVKMRLQRARRQVRQEALNMVEETLKQKSPGPEFEDRLGSSFAELTVLCADLAGWEVWAREMSAVEAASFLYDYRNELTDIAVEYGGTLDRHDNATLVAFFGAPLACEDHAERACLAALDMQAHLQEQWGQNRPSLRLSCGLSTGQVLVGNLGSRYRTDYTIAGDAVDLAARLARRFGGSIAITGSTCEPARNAVEVRELDQIACCGYKQPTTIYEVLCRRGELQGEKALLVQLYEQGLEHYRQKNWARALECFTRAGESDPPDWPSTRHANRCWVRLEVPSFEALTRLEGTEIQNLLRHVDRRDLLGALREADAALREVFFSQMSQRVQQFMEEELEAVQLTAWSREELAEYQRKIVETAARLAREGLISLDLGEVSDYQMTRCQTRINPGG